MTQQQSTAASGPNLVLLRTSPHGGASEPVGGETRAEALRLDIVTLADELRDELVLLKDGGQPVPLEIWRAVDCLAEWRMGWR